MNTKRLIPAMLLAMALVMFWSIGVNYVYKKMGWAPPGQPIEQTEPATVPTTSSTTASPRIVTTTQPAPPVAPIRPLPTTQTSEAILGSSRPKDENFVLAVHMNK